MNIAEKARANVIIYEKKIEEEDKMYQKLFDDFHEKFQNNFVPFLTRENNYVFQKIMTASEQGQRTILIEFCEIRNDASKNGFDEVINDGYFNSNDVIKVITDYLKNNGCETKKTIDNNITISISW